MSKLIKRINFLFFRVAGAGIVRKLPNGIFQRVIFAKSHRLPPLMWSALSLMVLMSVCVKFGSSRHFLRLQRCSNHSRRNDCQKTE
ncbi:MULTISPECIES: hypothetical protein [unclassified Bacteroides]|uniref:hypothetical protein n=1 Tax=unclassified Bacteroides TaxID=2646097 RepID=UPI0011C12C2C|nr:MULTISPECIES: hypothetical protein [unclassified Bacteroides]